MKFPVIQATAFLVAATAFASDPALAGLPVPGPVVGAGLPALGLFAAGYWLLRRRRSGS